MFLKPTGAFITRLKVHGDSEDAFQLSDESNRAFVAVLWVKSIDGTTSIDKI
jgi:hypothetical protein